MKYLFKTGLFLLILLIAYSCKKDEEEKDYNALKITSGSVSGFAYTYSPNKGFWSPVNATTKYVHLVFGDTDNLTVNGKDIISVLFYDEGTTKVTFPSAQGQHISVGITVQGNEKYYSADNAEIIISEFTNDRFKGTLSGNFISGGPEFEIVSMTMDIDIQMEEL